MDSTEITNSILDGVNLSSAVIKDANFANSSFKNIVMDRVFAKGTNFSAVNFSGATLTNSTMQFLFMSNVITDGMNSSGNIISKVKGLSDQQVVQLGVVQ
jgi:uncharacterized protein YjbI with pentapeptide repeats